MLQFLHSSIICSLPQIFLQSNPVARWHIGQGAINCIAFSNDGAYLATVGRDGMMGFSFITGSNSSSLYMSFSWALIFSFWPCTGYLRIFDFSTQKLVCGVKSYYGALLCCAWRWLDLNPLTNDLPCCIWRKKIFYVNFCSLKLLLACIVIVY